MPKSDVHKRGSKEIDMEELVALVRGIAKAQEATQLDLLALKAALLSGEPLAPLAPVDLGPVTKSEAEVIGARFWINVDTGGVRNAVPVERVPGHEDDGYGTISYNLRRTDVATHQGPKIARTPDQLYRSKEAADAAPRTTSSAKGKRHPSTQNLK